MPDDEDVVASADLDDAVFEVLHEAVRMARNEQIRTVVELRMRLQAQGKGRDALIDKALLVWAEREAQLERA